jgi:pyrimidine deaminase RibD-like protein
MNGDNSNSIAQLAQALENAKNESINTAVKLEPGGVITDEGEVITTNRGNQSGRLHG